jgi:hypothetical protein
MDPEVETDVWAFFASALWDAFASLFCLRLVLLGISGEVLCTGGPSCFDLPPSVGVGDTTPDPGMDPDAEPDADR